MAQPAGQGHIIAVVGGKGGVGKSVFAANFAVAMAIDAKNGPALIDCDPLSSGDLNTILGAKPPFTYGDALLGNKVRDGAQLKTLMRAINVGGPALHLLQLHENPEWLLKEDDEKVDNAMKLLRRSFPVTIIDCGSRLEGPVMKILDLASLILVVTNPDILVLKQTGKIIEKLQKDAYPTAMVQVVINRMPQNTPYTAQFIEQSLKRQILAVIPEDNAAASVSLSKGAPFVLVAPQSPATKGLFSLSRTLLEKRVLEQASALNRPTRPKPAAEASAAADASAKAIANGDKPVSKMGKEPTDPRSQFKVRVHRELVSKLDFRSEQLDSGMNAAKKNEIRDKATKILTDILNAQEHPYKSREESQKIVKEILDETFGLGPLEDLLADDAVKEIMVNRADLIYIEKDGLRKSNVTFSSNDQLRNVISRIVSPLGRVINESSPYVDARLPDGSRVHAIIPPLAIDGPMVTIRKFPKKRLNPSDLVKFGSMTQEMADFLRICVEEHKNILISGGTGSGKTTLLNVMSSFIPAHERILTVEDAAELNLSQEHVGRLESRPASIEGTGAVTIRDLVKQTLRMRPDRIIVGEVRDGAAMDLLDAMNTGHDGSMGTVHANTPRDALVRMTSLVQRGSPETPVNNIREMLASSVHYIVQQSRLSDGSRKVTHITEVAGMQGEIITTMDIFLFKESGTETTPDGRRVLKGKHTPTGFRPKFFEDLEKKGKKVPTGLFKAA